MSGSFNKLGNRRFLRFSLPARRTLRIRVQLPAFGRDLRRRTPQPDPDFVLSRASDVTVAEDGPRPSKNSTCRRTAGDYVLEIYDYSHIDPTATSRRGRTCMTVTITG